MAEIAIGAAVGEGFSLIRRRPGVVVTWGLAQVLVTAAAMLLFAPFFLHTFGDALRQARGGGAPQTPPDLQNIVRMQSMSYLVNLVSLFANSIIYCAVFRAVLHPEQGRFGYLRVGAPELFLFVLIIGGYIALMVGAVVAAIPIVIVAVILAGVHAVPAAVILGIVAGIAAFVVMAYLILRVSLVGPMMVDDGKFHLTEAWALTRGKVASLLAVGLVLLVVLIAVEMIIALVLIALGFGVVGSLAGGLRNLPVFFQQPTQVLLPKLAPLLAVAAVAWVPVAGALLAIMGAPWARAYRDLRPKGDISETFV
ncbi:MAG: hypothetical protein P4L73_06565 [Caulobacteraceae bacterium]|nr:hypothetical protein [Caulobacteraceae bacterium]